MKAFRALSLLAAVALPACGGDAPTEPDPLRKAASKLARAPLIAKVTKTLANLKTTLVTVTDGATAEAAKTRLSSLVTDLQDQVDKLGGTEKLTGALGGFKTSLTEKIGELLNDSEIQRAIGPALQKLKGLIAG